MISEYKSSKSGGDQLRSVSTVNMSMPPDLAALNTRINSMRAATSLDDMPAARMHPSGRVIRLKLMHGAQRDRPRTLPNMDTGATSTPQVPLGGSAELLNAYNDTRTGTGVHNAAEPAPGASNTTHRPAVGDIEDYRTAAHSNGTAVAAYSRAANQRNNFISNRDRILNDLRDFPAGDDVHSNSRGNLKPMGIRNTFLTTKQIASSTTSQPSQTSLPPPSHPHNTHPTPPTDNPSHTPPQDLDDLSAMGTNWAPPSSSFCQRAFICGSTGTTRATQGLCTPGSISQTSHSGTGSQYGTRRGSKVGTMPHIPTASRPGFKDIKHRGEPRYCEPLNGAPPSFHQRISELSNLESETIRWERAKKFKKKTKDKDS